MEVRSGTDPRNQDDDVRFRTTYYFRVFDVCPAAKDGSQADRKVPDTDSLYRFRMTGKASALFVKVHFESGTLKSYEIDPFGAAVVFNPSTGRYQYKSQRQLEEEAAREAAYGQLARLIGTRDKLKESLGETHKAVITAETLIERQLAAVAMEHLPEQSPGSEAIGDLRLGEITRLVEALKDSQAGSVAPAARAALLTILEPKLAEALADYQKAAVGAALAASADAKRKDLEAATDQLETFKAGLQNISTKSSAALAQAVQTLKDEFQGALSNISPASGAVCPGGERARRGFQVLGPEGWRTFNQDERLVMAMSSSGEPLISAMKELSGRVLQEQPDQTELLLALSRAALIAARAGRRINQLETDLERLDDITAGETAGKLIDRVLDEMRAGGTRPPGSAPNPEEIISVP